MLRKKQQEVFFVATPNSENQYTFELDVNSAGKDSFGYMSGTYEMVSFCCIFSRHSCTCGLFGGKHTVH